MNQGRTGGKPLAKAIRDAIRYCIEHDIMRKFLKKNGSEVQNMLMQEWKLEDALNYKEKKGREEGEKIGEIKEREKTIRALKGVLEPEVIAETLKQPVEYVLKVLDEAMVVSEEKTPYNAETKE